MKSKNKALNNIKVLNLDRDGVTPSRIICEVTTRNIYGEKDTTIFGIDNGLAQGEDSEKKVSFLNWVLPLSENCSTYLVTHAHIDHMGCLPDRYKEILKNGNSDFIVYSTHGTKLWMKNSLMDSFFLRSKEAQEQKKPSPHSEKDVIGVLSNTKGIDYEKPFSIGKNVKATFYQNGHIGGSALILIEVKGSCKSDNEINMLFTGDYKKDNSLFMVNELPEKVRKAKNLAVFIESTYGDKPSNEVKEEIFEKELYKILNSNKSKDDHFKVIIPAFSTETTQKILLKLSEMDIPKDVKIILDGKLAQDQTNLVLENPEVFGTKKEKLNFCPKGLEFASPNTKKQIINDNKNKYIVVVSGGMLNGTSKQYIQSLVSDPVTSIFLIGYKPKGNVGHVLANAKKGDKIEVYGKEVTCNANVIWTREFSSHAMQEELLEFLRQFEKINTVFIVHGEPQSRIALMKKIKKDKVLSKTVKEVEILNYKTSYLIGPYGILKTIGTIK